MGKSIAFLVCVAIGCLCLHAAGLTDGFFRRGNVEERKAFWTETAARGAPPGTSRSAVDALTASHGVTLDCISTSLRPPVFECRGDDPQSMGGTAVHPVVLELIFTFDDQTLAKFETRNRVVR